MEDRKRRSDTDGSSGPEPWSAQPAPQAPGRRDVIPADKAGKAEEVGSGTPSPSAKRALERIREVALGYPEAHEDFPWGDQVIKVRGKIFVFLGAGEQGFGMSTKLPQSHPMALSQPFATPTGYGLGKAGWVTSRFGPDEEPPLDLLEDWLDESYRAVAPKRLVAQLQGYSPGVCIGASMKAS